MKNFKSLFFVIVPVLYTENADAISFGLKFKGG